MSSTSPPIRSYAMLILLCFLIVKLGITSVFVCTKGPTLPISIWESSPALAKDEQALQTESGTSGTPSDPMAQVSHGAPDLTELQREIATLEAHLEEIKAKYFKTVAAKSGISPETLEHKRQQIEKERLQLKEERKRLAALKKEVDEKLSRVTEMQKAVQSKLDERKTLFDKRIKHLINVYTTMPPKKAAVLIEKLDMEVIIALFSRMKGDSVGQILPYVSAGKAAEISERLAKLGS